MNNTKELHGQIASLESKNDMLETELAYLHEMLMKCGFPQGIHTLKATVEEILADAPVREDKTELA